MTHTKGPWKVRPTYDPWAQIEYAPDDGLRSVIAHCYDTSLCPEHGGAMEANARLIAAAPDMKDGLQDICEGLTDEITRIVEGMKPDTSRLDYLANKAGRLIAKAEGREGSCDA